MAKKKTEAQNITNSLVQNWAEQNKQRLSEINTENPALYNGIIQALNYLNQTLGGTGNLTPVELPKRKFNIGDKVRLSFTPQVQTILDYEWVENKKQWLYEMEGEQSFREYESNLELVEDVQKPLWTKEDFIDSVVIVDSNAEARAYQKLVLELGFTWNGGLKTVFWTYARSFLIDSEDQYIQASTNVPSQATLNMWNVKVINFRDLGIEPIPEIVSIDEFVDSSVLIENESQYLFLTQKLEKGFNVRFDSDTMPYVGSYPRYFNIKGTKSRGIKFTVSSQAEFSIYYTIDEFGYPYKKSYGKGDRYIFKTANSYIYGKKINGQINYEIDFSSPRSLVSRWVNSIEETTDILWSEDKAFSESQLVKGISEGNILILKTPPKYREGQEFGGVKIMAIGYDQDTHKYKYQVYLQENKEFRRFDSEEELQAFLEISDMVDWMESKSAKSERSTEAPFLVGDKVKIPKTKRGKKVKPNMSIVIDIAEGLKQDYLYVTEVDGDTLVLDTKLTDTGDFFSIKKDNIELYHEKTSTKTQPVTKFKVGDKVKLPKTQDFIALGSAAQELVRKAKTKSQDYLYVNGLGYDFEGNFNSVYLNDEPDIGKGLPFNMDELELYVESQVKKIPQPKFKIGDKVQFKGATLTLTVKGVDWKPEANSYEYTLVWDLDGQEITEWDTNLELAPAKVVNPEPKFKKGDSVTYRGSQMTWTIEGVKWNDFFKEYSYDLWRDEDGKTTIELESKLEPWQTTQKPANNVDDDDLESALEDLEI